MIGRPAAAHRRTSVATAVGSVAATVRHSVLRR